MHGKEGISQYFSYDNGNLEDFQSSTNAESPYTPIIRKMITEASDHEAGSHYLGLHIGSKLSGIAQAVHLPEQDQQQILFSFVKEYVAQVPEFLDALRSAAYKSGIEEYVLPFIRTAERFFIHPPACVEKHLGLLALLDESYLAHRLIEEVNDRYIQRVGMPLIPMDLTLANVIVHQLIGEPFANELDSLVHDMVEQMMPQEQAYNSDSFQDYLSELKPSNIASIFQQWQWPSLTENWGLEFKFGI